MSHPPPDQHNLSRFVEAQETIYDQALAEIRAGQKTSHWMWFIFPQLAGLGMSEMSQHYAIKNLEEAAAYLAHPVLGPRLIECAGAAMNIQDKSAREIFGSPDDMKLKSSATLFAQVSSADSVFHQLIVKFYDDQSDEQTLRLLALSK